MKNFLKIGAIALICGAIGVYLGYSYAEYEDAFYCEKQAPSRLSL